MANSSVFLWVFHIFVYEENWVQIFCCYNYQMIKKKKEGNIMIDSNKSDATKLLVSQYRSCSCEKYCIVTLYGNQIIFFRCKGSEYYISNTLSTP